MFAWLYIIAMVGIDLTQGPAGIALLRPGVELKQKLRDHSIPVVQFHAGRNMAWLEFLATSKACYLV